MATAVKSQLISHRMTQSARNAFRLTWQVSTGATWARVGTVSSSKRRTTVRSSQLLGTKAAESTRCFVTRSLDTADTLTCIRSQVLAATRASSRLTNKRSSLRRSNDFKASSSNRCPRRKRSISMRCLPVSLRSVSYLSRARSCREPRASPYSTASTR